MKGAVTPISRRAGRPVGGHPTRMTPARPSSAREWMPSFSVDATERVADRLRGEECLFRDLPVGQTARRQLGDASLGLGQLRPERAAGGRHAPAPARACSAQTAAPRASKSPARRAASRRRGASPSGGGAAGPWPAACGARSNGIGRSVVPSSARSNAAAAPRSRRAPRRARRPSERPTARTHGVGAIRAASSSVASMTAARSMSPRASAASTWSPASLNRPG